MNLYDDVIDVRDIIERLEELESDIDFQCTASVYGLGKEAELKAELKTLVSIMDEMQGYGGDEQWRGDWYPLTLIRESHFTDYVQEMLEDCGEIPKDLPHYIHIDWQATARDVQVDYTPIEVDGATYFYR
jgi:antirestriction protein